MKKRTAWPVGPYCEGSYRGADRQGPLLPRGLPCAPSRGDRGSPTTFPIVAPPPSPPVSRCSSSTTSFPPFTISCILLRQRVRQKLNRLYTLHILRGSGHPLNDPFKPRRQLRRTKLHSWTFLYSRETIFKCTRDQNVREKCRGRYFDFFSSKCCWTFWEFLFETLLLEKIILALRSSNDKS